MGLTKVTAKLTSLQEPNGSFEALFLVDIGATDSMAPADELEKIGVAKEGKRSYELSDGSMKEYAYGFVRIEFMGEVTVGRVVFGEPGAEPAFGSHRARVRGHHGRPGKQDS
jgi:hypothetical protein